nr:protein spaetzle 5-like [Onthophagus taurus]
MINSSSILIIYMMLMMLTSTSICEGIFTPDLNGAENSENFWFNVTNYPYKKIEELITKLNNTAYLQVQTRFAEEFENYCVETKRKLLPQAAMNNNDQTMFIVNVENLRQEIEVVKCRDNCGEITVSTMNTRCDKEYIELPLIAVTENGQLITENFRYHTTCYCACEN